MPPGKEQPDASAVGSMEVLVPIVGDAIDAAARRVPGDDGTRIPRTRTSTSPGSAPTRPARAKASARQSWHPVLARCDADGIPAYLESTKPRNIAFYERHGFAVTGTIAPAPDGPPMWCMWRDPK